MVAAMGLGKKSPIVPLSLRLANVEAVSFRTLARDITARFGNDVRHDACEG